jgi:coenzyme F420-reducing hydrogenase delta subunit
MRVGPPGWTGRDQLVEVKAFVAREKPGPEDVVLLACDRGAGDVGELGSFEGAPIYRAACVGSVHTSVIEYLIQTGAGGLLIVSCPPRDCWNREGVSWLEERVHHDREAELKARVDRKRLRITFAALAERKAIAVELEDFRREVRAMAAATGEEEIEIDTECETPR